MSKFFLILFTLPLLASQSVKDFGAKGDGITDDTLAWQAALTSFANASGRLDCPVGTYLISSPLVYIGSNSFALNISGDIGGTGAPGTGCHLKFTGSGVLLTFLGANYSQINNVDLDGGTTALWIDATNEQAGGSPGSTATTLTNVSLSNWTSNGLLIAHPHVGSSTEQVSEITLNNVRIVGNGAGTCLSITESGNVKNFTINGGTMNRCDYGVNKPGSGSFAVKDLRMSHINVVDFELGPVAAVIEGTEVEDTGSRFVHGNFGANPGVLFLRGNAWESTAASDDVMLEYDGILTMIGNKFYNYRTATSYPKIINTAVSFGSINSQGNYYRNAVGSVPFSGGVPYTSIGDLGGKAPLGRLQ